MQIIVLSDNHGRSSVVERIVDAHPGCDTYLHLGDSQGGMAHIQELYPNKTFYCVRGNCDGSCDYPDELELTFQGHHLLAVHGHQQGVKYSLSALLAEGRRRGADICLFGHTHQPCQQYQDGIYLLNPGSCARPAQGRPTYGVLDIRRDQGVLFSLAEV
ncbi:Phosphodiesterase yfcE [Anaerotruncus sp. 2789STDY5834896]|uniref:Phosphoesterase n=1 Tax=uncultured Anaerotruncus sp. TaxID=905011 RepID=A0A1C6KAG3_9FIRM|nr:Phosphodiesterase yfcE [uncultured Anaerotruncus sp.]